ncbi:MAG: homocysteine S-methyltransferase family protein [Deltaproteobacteria bacterium]|nr:homocysteine S-methyltransferase family protein [Deltaproteobacteria bacterium]MBW2445903.1 homocysteine S-methyltransferase family protein [Deltaproteobacteria bacterium]
MTRRDPRTGATKAMEFTERWTAGKPLLLDGALGTEIERRGGDAGLPLWSARALCDDPALVAQIHRDYVTAGAEVVVANTFRTQARALAHGGLADRAAELTHDAAWLARDATARAPGPCWVAGSAPTLEDCYRPDLVPDEASLAREHGEHAANLAAAGVDVVFAETLNTVREARAALRAAHEAGLPAIASFVCDGSARLLSGEPLAAAVEAAAGEGAIGVGVNCLPARAARACLPTLTASGLPFLVYANLGEPTEDGAFRSSDELSPDAFAREAGAWLEAGAHAVGGCCGTTPGHLAAIERLVSIRRGPRTQFASPRA